MSPDGEIGGLQRPQAADAVNVLAEDGEQQTESLKLKTPTGVLLFLGKKNVGGTTHDRIHQENSLEYNNKKKKIRKTIRKETTPG